MRLDSILSGTSLRPLILFFPLQSDVIDSYYNMTLKEVLDYKYILSLPWTSRPDYIVKVDDDSYVNIPELWRVFPPTENKMFPSYDLLVGYSMVNARVMKDGSHPADEPRLLCPLYMYSGTKYPTYLSGAGKPIRTGCASQNLHGNISICFQP